MVNTIIRIWVGPYQVWRLWTDMIDLAPIPHDTHFADLIIPTVDTARYTYLLEKAIKHKQEALFVGPTGTGKSVYINPHLMKGLPHDDYMLNPKALKP